MLRQPVVLWNSALLAVALAPLPAQRVAKNVRIDELIRGLEEPAHATRAAERLVLIGRPAVRPLLRRGTEASLSPRGAELLNTALQIIGTIGPDAVSAVPSLVALIMEVPAAALPALLETLGDLAPFAHAKHPSLLDEIEPRILGRVHDTRLALGPVATQLHRVRERCRLRPRTDMAVLLETVKSDNPYERELAAELLGRRGPAAQAAIPALEGHLSLGAFQVATVVTLAEHHVKVISGPQSIRAVALAITRIAPRDPAAVLAHAALLDAGRPIERVASAIALRGFGPETASVVNDLASALDKPDLQLRREVITTLGLVGPDAADFAFKIEILLDAEDADLRARAVAALKQIQRKPEVRIR